MLGTKEKVAKGWVECRVKRMGNAGEQEAIQGRMSNSKWGRIYVVR